MNDFGRPSDLSVRALATPLQLRAPSPQRRSEYTIFFASCLSGADAALREVKHQRDKRSGALPERQSD